MTCPTTGVCSAESHNAIKADPNAFAALPYRGEMEDEMDDGSPATLVLRNCSCGSTLCVRYPATPMWLTILRDGGLL